MFSPKLQLPLPLLTSKNKFYMLLLYVRQHLDNEILGYWDFLFSFFIFLNFYILDHKLVSVL